MMANSPGARSPVIYRLLQTGAAVGNSEEPLRFYWAHFSKQRMAQTLTDWFCSFALASICCLSPVGILR